jgi:3-isopropylmalate/(R)-2-methylmalate dehydratase large subunit
MSFVFATGKLWFRVPQTFRFEVEGKLPRCVYPKDIILHLIGDVGVEGARYMASEFCGSTVRNMDIPGRMTMSNMAIEMGGKAGIVEADKTTEKYLAERIPGFKLDQKWKSDDDAIFAESKQYDVSDLSPQVACPHNVKKLKEQRSIRFLSAHVPMGALRTLRSWQKLWVMKRWLKESAF